ncbi:MAG: T9SS type A sorting domain-containing protein [Chitinophagales bacterium]|nr:T9SS type A sorting domain-containing protein [Chitinophagales bacterium]
MIFFSSKKIYPLLFSLFFSAIQSYSQSSLFWKNISINTLDNSAQDISLPQFCRLLQLDVDGIKSFLKEASSYSSTIYKADPLIISIPMPDGSSEDFQIRAYAVMAEGLSTKFPSIKTYKGVGISDRHASIRLDLTDEGFHTMILSPRGQSFIDPVPGKNSEIYMSYYKKDLSPACNFICGIKTEDSDFESVNSAWRSIGTELRTYRLALACTGEYARTKGDSVAGALAAMVTSLNRVDGIYEQEFDIHLVLVDSEEKIIFLDGTTDPYTNNDGYAMLSENQAVIDDSIGSDNYDVGHVFSTGGGGIAGLGVVCNNGRKAMGVTGLSNPVGDAFDVDYVAHEMGHQFGANHTFNSETVNCGGGNRNAFTAYEPGSGSTIMAYAGICGINDLQPHSDPYFHTENFDEVVNFTQLVNGNNCPVVTPIINKAPSVNAGSDYSIPFNTPFVLNGSAIDSDGAALTFCWEEMDRGLACDWNKPLGTAPLFRSFRPDTVSYRIFPKLSSIVANKIVIGEILPAYARVMKFRLTVRDNRLDGAAVAYNDQFKTITVVNTEKAFRVTYPDSSGYFQVGTSKSITWEVAGTDTAPINCKLVNILLSRDGGFSYPDTLMQQTANDGNELVTIANDTGWITTTARIKVEAADNIFFDISNLNFRLGTDLDTTLATGTAVTKNIENTIEIYPNPVGTELNIRAENLSSSEMNVRLLNIMGQVVPFPLYPKVQQHFFSYDIHQLLPGIYFVWIETNKRIIIRKIIKE